MRQAMPKYLTTLSLEVCEPVQINAVAGITFPATGNLLRHSPESLTTLVTFFTRLGSLRILMRRLSVEKIYIRIVRYKTRNPLQLKASRVAFCENAAAAAAERDSLHGFCLCVSSYASMCVYSYAGRP